MPEGVIPPGKIKCFITGKLRKDKSEERVRQDVARGLVEEYGYDKNDIDIEFPIKMGRAKKRADIVIFSESDEHAQENIYMIVEVKTEDVKPSDKKAGVGQLESYIAASPNNAFALWVGDERLAFKVIEEGGEKSSNPDSRCPNEGSGCYPQTNKRFACPCCKFKTSV